nr:Uma2 family endonuclease [Armatimonas sp.]
MPTLIAESKTYQRFAPERVIGQMSVDEWVAFLERSKQKSNYICGEVVEVAGASPQHNQIAMNFGRALGNVLEATEANCDVLGSDQKVSVTSGLYYFPDLCVVCGEWKVDLYDALQNPCVIVEVLSPSTEADDRTDKFREYQQITTLRHYILIDQSRVAVTHFEKLAVGLWAIVGDFRSQDDALKIILGEVTVTVPLSQVYRRVAFPES